jgi:LysM repeat protein
MVAQSINPISNTNTTTLLDRSESDTQNYTVQQGDTLNDIANRYATTADNLMALNPQLTYTSPILAGDSLNIPSSRSYTTQYGDTLPGIADRFGVSVDDLVQTNSILNPDVIYPNETLTIPNNTPAISTLQADNDPDTSSSNGMDMPTPGQLPGTFLLSDSEKYDYYADIIDQQSPSTRSQLDEGEKVVLSLRVDTNTHANDGNGVYDDRMVLLWQDSNGVKHVRELKANLDPSAQYEYIEGEDANQDGILDQGRLADGTYTFQRDEYKGEPAYRSTSDQIAQRDTDHNGIFDDNILGPPARLTDDYLMHIHLGGENNTSSAGCLTLKREQHTEFFNILGDQPSLTNVIVNTAELEAPPEPAPRRDLAMF